MCTTIWSIGREAASRGPSALGDILVASVHVGNDCSDGVLRMHCTLLKNVYAFEEKEMTEFLQNDLICVVVWDVKLVIVFMPRCKCRDLLICTGRIVI